MAEPKPKDLIGCSTALWSILVTGPMRLVLLFVILNSIDVPTFAWVLYWCYVPASVLGVLAASVFRSMSE